MEWLDLIFFSLEAAIFSNTHAEVASLLCESNKHWMGHSTCVFSRNILFIAQHFSQMAGKFMFELHNFVQSSNSNQMPI